ncbi:MAG TPA: hypothetical protein VEY93_02185 [Longimicrobium sp.]|nr:hypothetical protein [Longimicrobium sp.]
MNINAVHGAVAALFLALPLHGQEGRTDIEVRFRNQCRLAAQVLDTGHPHPHREWALGYIGNCENEGPAVLASVWRTASVGGEDLTSVVWSSLRLRDARLFQQLRATATDRTRPVPMRVAAMLVLARYTDPRNAVWLTDLVPPDSIRRIPQVLSSGTGFYPIPGAVPMEESVAVPVLALLEQLAAARNTEERAVWYAAAVLAKRIRRDIERGFAH